MKAIPAIVLPLLLVASCGSNLDSELDSLLGGRVGPAGPGLAVLVTRQSQVLLQDCRGLANLSAKTSIDARTNFRLASVTKQFTALGILLLAADGKLRLDQRLTEFFPDFPPYGSAITLRHLLTHTSGVPDYESLISDTATVPVLDQDVLRLLESTDSTLFPPGSEFRYSNSGYALLALVVERVSKMRFADFLKSRIFLPLGMKGTVAFEKGRSSVDRRAYGYSPDDQEEGTFKETDQSLTSSVLGDGGVYSSLADLRRWTDELSNPAVLSPDVLQEAMSAQVPTSNEGESYGYGWFVTQRDGHRLVRHSGTTIGFRTEIQRYPDSGLTIIILSNRSDLNVTEIAYGLADGLLEDSGQ